MGWVLATALGLALVATPQCGFEDSTGPGDPCTRDTQCEGELVCVGGVCSEARDAGDGGDVDAGDGGE